MLIIAKKGNKYPLYINYVLISIVLDILQLFIFKSSKQFYKTVKHKTCYFYSENSPM